MRDVYAVRQYRETVPFGGTIVFPGGTVPLGGTVVSPGGTVPLDGTDVSLGKTIPPGGTVGQRPMPESGL